ncbi:HEAT repeat domain-containing protein [Oscillatoria sp. FACHB-1406]|uniref:HEAT repeat domain-containing protein n=1 Tax=Oscillatoria sp. FACHB-1406 TaxID=2692846 RepID=UPI001686352E|nr:HEAT repeat domain-containing protein [Oscillatoria sp. FACHB-1406]MBD2576216.1 HEAT repeat domain-containing protein [Oscillatoria sp. FACHB-1406]
MTDAPCEAARSPDFQPYLQAIRQRYERWWEVYSVTDVRGRENCPPSAPPYGKNSSSPFDFGLTVQVVTPEEKRPQQPLPVLERLRKYVFDEKTRHLLLVGRPGSGKSTALARLLLEESNATSGVIPVLVELRYWQTSIEALILDFFGQHGLKLNETQLETLLVEKRFLLLMDGINELSSETARSQLNTFRQTYRQLPIIFTTRDLSLGGDFGIEKKLEMQRLTEPQIQAFVRAYLSEPGEELLRQSQGKLRQFGETPLLLWMLCEVFQQSPQAQLPRNLGGIFQVFARSYENSSVRKHEVAPLKGDTKPLSERKLWAKALEHLAGLMVRGKNSVELEVTIERQVAERELEGLFQGEPFPPKTARDCLDDLLKYHLLQMKVEDKIEFLHQLIQEYYAAEALLARLPELSDAELKRDYLNYLKWTEPVALMLGLVGDETQALRVVRLALEVDWRLGARLAGEVKRDFQEQTVGIVTALDVPQGLKWELWVETRSDVAVSELVNAGEDESSWVRQRAAEVLGKLGSEAAIPGLLSAVRGSVVEALGKLGSEAAIPRLLSALEDEDSWVRKSAVEALGKLGLEAAIPGLLSALEDEDSWVRESAVKALGKLGSEAAIPGLLWTLEDEDYRVRESAVKALGKLGSEAAIPGLLWALEYEDSDGRESTVETLGKLGSEAAIPGLLWTLEDEDYRVRESAVKALGKLGSEAAIPGLLWALENESSLVRESAVKALGKLGSEAAIPGLLFALEDESSRVRESAVEAIGKLGSEEVIPGLLSALKDEDDLVSMRAVEAIGELHSDAAIPGLLCALEDESYCVYKRAVEALGKLGSEAAITVLFQVLENQDPARCLHAAEALWHFSLNATILGLIESLKNPHFFVRWSAVQALEKIGLETAIIGTIEGLKDRSFLIRWYSLEILWQISLNIEIFDLLHFFENYESSEWEYLKELYKDQCKEKLIMGFLKDLDRPEYFLRWSAVKALGKLPSKTGIPGLVKSLKDREPLIRLYAIQALCNQSLEAGMLGAIEGINDPDICVRLYAMKALEELGSEVAIPGFLQTLGHEDSLVRQRAAEVLGKLGSEVAIPGLLSALEDEDFWVRKSAVEALGELGSEAAIPGLLNALKDKYSDVRESAVKALGKLSSEAAIPGLLSALEDEDSRVRESAVKALGKLGSEAAIPGLLCALENEDSRVRESAVKALGKLGSEAAIPGLLNALEDESSRVRNSAVEAFGNLKNDRAAHILPHLLTLIPTESGESAFRALTAIQANCKFYNYDLFKSPPLPTVPATPPAVVRYEFHNTEVVTIVEKNNGEVIGKQISEAE